MKCFLWKYMSIAKFSKIGGDRGDEIILVSLVLKVKLFLLMKIGLKTQKKNYNFSSLWLYQDLSIFIEVEEGGFKYSVYTCLNVPDIKFTDCLRAAEILLVETHLLYFKWPMSIMKITINSIIIILLTLTSFKWWKLQCFLLN